MFAVRNVMTDAWTGDLTVVDDDLTPRHRAAGRGRSTRGRPAQWVEARPPVGYDTTGCRARWSVVWRPTLAAGDVPPDWLASSVGSAFRPLEPLWSYSPAGLRRPAGRLDQGRAHGADAP